MGCLGLSLSEVKRYSFSRALGAICGMGGGDFEREVSTSIAKKFNLPETGTYQIRVPGEVLTRDLSATASGSSGGYLVSTENTGFIDLLRPRSVVMSAGATVISGLRSNVTVPRQTAGASFTWLPSEGTAATESQPTFGQVILTPKTVAGYTELSRQLLLQSNQSAEQIVRNDLARGAATALDVAALNGSGVSGQPTGILNTAGLGTVVGTSLDYAKIIEFQSDVASANGLSTTCAYITTPTIAGLLKQRYRVANTDTALWQGSLLNGNVEGFAGLTSNNVPAGTVIFGDWSQLIVGEFGPGIELAVNPYANFASGIVGVRVMYSVDVAVGVPGAFSIATSVT